MLSREVGRFKGNKGKWKTLEVSTIRCGVEAMAIKPYETAISWSRRYKHDPGEWVVVEAYDTEELAKAGHAVWVQVMLKSPPDKLVDCCNFSVMANLKKRGLLSLDIEVVEAKPEEH